MVSIIVAIGKNRAIGKNNRLLWNLPRDLEHFRKVTSGHTVVMGDRTFESIGKPLPNRKNIVVTLKPNYRAPGCEVRNSLEEVLREAKVSPEEVFIIGGGQIYRQSLPWADKLYLTVVDDEPEADTFFPNYSDFSKIVSEESISDGGYNFKFLELIKK